MSTPTSDVLALSLASVLIGVPVAIVVGAIAAIVLYRLSRRGTT